MSQSCWGVFREATHSPGRVSDDTEILRLTGKELEARGFQVTLATADEVDAIEAARPRFVFLMCERMEVLHRLRALEATGVPHLNSPEAVYNTYRHQMVRLLDKADVGFIPSRLVATDETADPGPRPVWVKRGDVHNTQEGDVVLALTASAVGDALRGLAGRGIPRAVLQPHVEGDLIKFYGIGAPGDLQDEPTWFRWFYHKDQRVAGCPLDPRRLGRRVARAAAALGLEVYGGDAIATAAGELVLLDVNAWPSFALYRDEASAAIASHLARRFPGAGQ